MKKEKRQANYELLRIIAMLMVVTMHYLNNTGALLVLGENADAQRLIGTLLESFCIVAVNVYVLISGYFLVNTEYKVKRIVILICQILFYSVLIPLIMMGTGMFAVSDEGGIYRIIQYLLPIETEHYWFATSYVLLYLFTPVLNFAVKNMTKRQFQITLGGLLVLFAGIKSICPIRLVTDRFGYDFGWFLCVYLLAAYLRLYGIDFFASKDGKRQPAARRAVLVYLSSALLIFAVTLISYVLNLKTGAFAYYFTVPFHYNYIFCLTGAVALFYAFRYLKLPEGRAADVICRIAPLTFGVYLFHEHIEIRDEWTGWIEDFIAVPGNAGIGYFLIKMLLSVFLVYAAGIFIDAIRKVVFDYMGRGISKTRFAVWLESVDKLFNGR